jgi:hypothetical protein
MSIASVISDIKTKIFGANKPKLEKIYPKFDNEFIPDRESMPVREFMPDIEAGEWGFYRRLKQRQMDLELYSKPKNWDPEKCEKSITWGEEVVVINGYENYMPFMDVVNYFVIHNEQKSSLVGSISETISPYEERLSANIGADIIKDESIDKTLYLCSDNIV